MCLSVPEYGIQQCPLEKTGEENYNVRMKFAFISTFS